MELKNQVCTLEQAKRLKELGIEQESLFYHIPWKASDFDGCFICQPCDKGFYHAIDGMVETLDAPEYYSAFTVAELGVMLLGYTDKVFQRNDGTWALALALRLKHVFQTEAQARAEMLIHLICDCGLITAADCNQRLKNS